MRSSLLFVAAALCVAAPIDAQQIPHFHRKLKEGKVVLRSAIVFPAIVSFSKIGFKGAEGMERQADVLGESLYRLACGELTARGVDVLPLSAKDDTERYRIADLQGKFDVVRLPLRRRPGRVEKGAFTMGDTVATFEPGKADVFVFLRADAMVPSRGNKLLGAIVLNPLRAWGRVRGDLTVVDARSGDVLAFIRFADMKNVAEHTEERLRAIIHPDFRELPLPNPPQK